MDAPTHCECGNRFGPYRVLVDAPRCLCGLGETGHHTRWQCRACGRCQYSDGHTDNSKLALPEPPLTDAVRIEG